MALLQVENLTVEYHRPGAAPLRVLDVPEFRLDANEKMALKGRSGSGKTTLLNVVSGILPPASGRVSLDGRDLTGFGEAARDLFRGRNIGFVFQTFNLLQGFTALENVLLGSVFAGDPDEEPAVTRARARDLLAKVGLSDREHHLPRMLSAGEQQRVAIARALMNKPRLILADEPTGSLDEKNSGEVLDLMLRLASTFGAALLLATHDPLVMAHFTRIVDMRELNKAR
jgi:putative ABC transport system ATP-binding protein